MATRLNRDYLLEIKKKKKFYESTINKRIKRFESAITIISNIASSKAPLSAFQKSRWNVSNNNNF